MAINLMEAFENEPVPLDFVLPGLLAGTIGILSGEGGVGKSWWVVEAAYGVASRLANKSLLNLPIEKHGAVVIQNAEDNEHSIRNRIYSLAKHLSMDARRELDSNVTHDDLLGKSQDILDRDWQAAIRHTLTKKNARLLVIDTLSRFHRGDENSNKEMGQLMAVLESIARDTNCAIILVHHLSKSMALNGRQNEQQSVRGASLLVNNARWQAYVASMSENEARKQSVKESLRGMYVRFGISKQNYAKPFEECWLKRSVDGVLLSALPSQSGVADFKVYKSRRGVFNE